MNRTTNQLNWADVENLKASARYYHAGALAYILGYPNNYGCHFGMRSTYHSAIAEFKQGWNDAHFECARTSK